MKLSGFSFPIKALFFVGLGKLIIVCISKLNEHYLGLLSLRGLLTSKRKSVGIHCERMKLKRIRNNQTELKKFLRALV